jgi:hypothetical protein
MFVMNAVARAPKAPYVSIAKGTKIKLLSDACWQYFASLPISLYVDAQPGEFRAAAGWRCMLDLHVVWVTVKSTSVCLLPPL